MEKKVYSFELTEVEALRLVTALHESLDYLRERKLDSLYSATRRVLDAVQVVVYNYSVLANI